MRIDNSGKIRAQHNRFSHESQYEVYVYSIV